MSAASSPSDAFDAAIPNDAIVIQAPMAGGPSTPQLAAAVSDAGGLGFIAAGYLAADRFAADIVATRALTARPFGVNVFVPSPTPASRSVVATYADAIAPFAARGGVDVGTPRFDDDEFDAKVAVVMAARPAVVSFTFGVPDPGTIRELRAREVQVWITVTSADEARAATACGADAVIAQGAEAGGHQGSFVDADVDPLPLLELLVGVREVLGTLPERQRACRLIGAGGMHTGPQIVAALHVGADAVQLGTAFMRCPEAATARVIREALAQPAATTLTRAFTGRRARGIVNAWTHAHPNAPSAYPEIHHLTAPIRAAGRAAGDPDLVNLWAGVHHELAREVPAGQLVQELLGELASLRPRRP